MSEPHEEDMDELRAVLECEPEPPDEEIPDWSDPNSDGSTDFQITDIR